MIRARFRLRLSRTTWHPEVSRSFPRAEFRLLSTLETDTGSIDLVEVVADDPEAVAAAVESESAVEEFERLERTDRRVQVRYLDTAPRNLFEIAEDASLPPEYPIVLRDGWASYDLTGSRDDFERFRERLDAWNANYELHSVLTTADADALLTERQRQALVTAFRAGYFEVPRECTLADVAGAMDVDKSTASGLIRRAEQRILSRFLLGSDVNSRS